MVVNNALQAANAANAQDKDKKQQANLAPGTGANPQPNSTNPPPNNGNTASPQNNK